MFHTLRIIIYNFFFCVLRKLVRRLFNLCVEFYLYTFFLYADIYRYFKSCEEILRVDKENSKSNFEILDNYVFFLYYCISVKILLF